MGPPSSSSDYSAAEKTLWKGYLISATPIVTLPCIAFCFAVFVFIFGKRSLPSFDPATHSEAILGLVFFIWLIVFWGQGALHYEGLKKSRREYFFLLFSFAPYAYLIVDIISYSSDDNPLLEVIFSLFNLAVFAPAVFLASLLAVRSY